MARPALLLAPLVLAVAVLAGAALRAQQERAPSEAAPTAEPAPTLRYSLVRAKGKGHDVIVFDAATGRVFVVDDANTRTVIDPVAGVARTEAVRWPQRERVARAFQQALQEGDLQTLKQLVRPKDRDGLTAERVAELKQRYGALPLDALVRELGKRLRFSEEEGRWAIRD